MNPKEEEKKNQEFPCLLGGHLMTCEYPSSKKRREGPYTYYLGVGETLLTSISSLK
jgi:hypothetical protein